MSINPSIGLDQQSASQPRWRSYIQLCKPKVVALIVYTAVIGMLLAAPGFPPWRILVFATLGIGLAAASGAAINHWVDRHIDAVMARTRRRPLPTGNLHATNALYFAMSLGVAGLLILAIEINALTAALTAASLIGYAIIYTVYLKRTTPYNIVLGGAAGAAPPLLGWVAVTGTIDLQAVILFLIIFWWTPPHFWALAIRRKDEYARAGIPMLPVTHGVDHTKLQIVFYVLVLVAVSVMPAIIGMSGLVYLAGAIPLGAIYVWHAANLYRDPNNDHAMKAFRYSIVYLSSLFALLLMDHYVSAIRESLSI